MQLASYLSKALSFVKKTRLVQHPTFQNAGGSRKIRKHEISKRRRLPEKEAERFSWGLACRSGASWLTEESTLALATQKSTRHALATHTRVDEPIEGGAAAPPPPLWGHRFCVWQARVLCSFVWQAQVCFPL